MSHYYNTDGQIQTVDVDPAQILINKEIIAGLMGFDVKDIPVPFGDIIAGELAVVQDFSGIKGGMRISNHVAIDADGCTFSFEGILFRAGRQVTTHLKGAERLALYICTAGEGREKRIRDLTSEGKLMEAYVADLVGSVMVEGAMDVIHQHLQEELKTSGLFLTNRYSPGYCDWRVDEQHLLFGLFPENFCGVRLTDSALMRPVKSVSGVIGIGKTVRYDRYTCHACSSVNCLYRNKKHLAVGGTGS